jgi:hypothetical protein
MAFHKGQKVMFVTYKAPWHLHIAALCFLCIIQEPPQGYFSFEQPYVIAAVEHRCFGVFTHLHFANGPQTFGRHVFPGWLSCHFRPLIEYRIEAGMAVVRDIVAAAPSAVPAEKEIHHDHA